MRDFFKYGRRKNETTGKIGNISYRLVIIGAGIKSKEWPAHFMPKKKRRAKEKVKKKEKKNGTLHETTVTVPKILEIISFDLKVQCD